MKKTLRIAKYIARSGYCSRRKAEHLISLKKVQVNGEVIKSPIFFISENDDIFVNNTKIFLHNKTRLWLYNKPKGVICTNCDPEGRKTIFEDIPADLPRVILVGRLDYNTEGLLLLTNNGALSRKLELPSSKIIRKYLCKVYGKLNFDFMKEKLENEIIINNIKYKVASITLRKQKNLHSWLEIKLTEGKNREIRNIMEYFHLKVSRLIRLQFGNFQLSDLKTKEIVEVPESLLLKYLKDL